LDRALAALVAGEDRRFYSHPGFDLIGIIRAVTGYLLNRKISGASTIEQQLVRTIRGRYELTVGRKLSEIAIAIHVSQRFTKRQLALAYLKVAYFGWQGNGLEAIASTHRINLAEATAKEAAFFAAMLKYPLPQHPSRQKLERVLKRAQYIEEIVVRSRGKHGMDN
jgi:penicillin-binding protein 1A